MPQLVDHSTATTELPHEGQSISVVDSSYPQSDIKSETQKAQHEKDKLAEEARKLKKEASEKAERAKAKSHDLLKDSKSVAVKYGRDTRTYNLIDSIVLVAVGVAGYRRYKEGRLDYSVVGISILGLGALATAQGYLQAWFRRQ